MKYLFIAIGLFVTLITLSWQSRQEQAFMQPHPCDAVLDSANVLVKAGGLVMEASEDTSALGKRYSRILFWLQERPFPELQCLLRSNNSLHRIYGFILSGHRYPDSVAHHLVILKDTSHVLVYINNKLVDPKMTVGKIAEMMYQQMLKDKVDRYMQPVVQDKVTSFIATYATYPSTFKLISFDEYSFGGIDSTDMYSVKLTYLLKSSTGRLLRQSSQFVVDNKFRINVIAKDSTNYFSSYPPILDSWLCTFGRKLTVIDSVQLGLTQVQ